LKWDGSDFKAATTVDQLFAPGIEAEKEKKAALVKVVFFLLERGRPIYDYEELLQLLHHLETPDLSKKHVSMASGWQFAEAIDAWMLAELQRSVAEAPHVSISVDTSEAVGHVDYMDVEVYWCDQTTFKRECKFVALVEVGGNTDAQGITKLIKDVLVNYLKVICFSSTSD
jgi:hypothetical protein